MTRFKLVFVCDVKRKFNTRHQPLAKYTFETPVHVTGTSYEHSDIDLHILDSQQNAILWGIRNPTKAIAAYNWIHTMTQLVEQAVKEHSPRGIVMHYAQSMLLWTLSTSVLKLPVYILHFAPALLNKQIPWVFDHCLKDPAFQLYDTTTEYYSKIKETWISHYYKMSGLKSMTTQQLKSVLNKATHLLCWDQYVMPKIDWLISEENAVQLGALFNATRYASKKWYDSSMKIADESAIPKKLIEFVEGSVGTGKDIVFMTFGSYADNPALKKVIPILLAVIEASGLRVLYHYSIPTGQCSVTSSSKVYVHEGWLPYEWAVHRSRAVVFTGSVCLKSLCEFVKVPMLFVPLLAEQFFWARNYEAMTSVPFISYLDTPKNMVTKAVAALRDSPHLAKRYLEKISKSMKIKTHTATHVMETLFAQ